MGMFRDNEFDLILFSFNGLGYISHEDRLQALDEIHRIGKPGGYFCFSAHNLRHIRRRFALWRQSTWRPRTMLRRTADWFTLSVVHNNPLYIMKKLRGSEYAIFNDGAHNHSLLTYYITPSAQVDQLKNHFQNVRAFLRDGHEATLAELATTNDWWIYFLCNIKQ